MDSGAVTGHAVGVDRAAVPDCLQRLDGGLDHGTCRLAVAGGDKADTAGIMFHLRTIDTGVGKTRLVAGPAGEIGGFVEIHVIGHYAVQC